MKFLYKLEDKWGSKSIKNLPLITVIIFSLSYVLGWLAPDVYEKLVFDPFAVFGSGEVWRVFTWIFTMPGSFNYFTLVMLFVYVMIGRSVEMSIGTFMYNIYIFSMLLVLTLGDGLYLRRYIPGFCAYLFREPYALYVRDTDQSQVSRLCGSYLARILILQVQCPLQQGEHCMCYSCMGRICDPDEALYSGACQGYASAQSLYG